MKNKLKYIIPITLILVLILGITCYAVTEDEVKAAVDESSKEKVSGNLFVWFLCAIAFMKVSQKIDSFMSSLGVSVGRTGGSMLGEAMIVARTIGGAVKSGAGGFGKGSSVGGGTQTGGKPAGLGGMFGGIGRKMSGNAAAAVAGKNSGGGVMSSISKAAYTNSINKGGSFATSVISSVARGNVAQMGTISGENGKMAMESYFGYNSNVNQQSGQNVNTKQSSQGTLTHGGATTITKNSSSQAGVNVSGSVSGPNSPSGGPGTNPGGAPTPSGSGVPTPSSGANVPMPSGGGTDMPTFTDIEIGGGRITGFESTIQSPQPREFAMYDAEKYAKPEGHFETITAVDDSKWYKQYATPTVEKTPYMDTKGKIQYNEKIVDKMPKAPMRKDRM